MRWYFDSGLHDYADKVLAFLEQEQHTAVVPVFWRYEVCSVLARAEIRGFLTEQTVRAFFDDLAALEIEVDLDGADRILTEVHRVAVTFRLTSYDAAYLELAMRRKPPLATLDEELLVACKAAGVEAFDPTRMA